MNFLLKVLKENCVGTAVIDLAEKIIAYLLVHRKPGMDAPDYFSLHDDAITEMEQALKAVLASEEISERTSGMTSFSGSSQRSSFSSAPGWTIRRRP